jgi:hypothetical protein
VYGAEGSPAFDADSSASSQHGRQQPSQERSSKHEDEVVLQRIGSIGKILATKELAALCVSW